MSDDDEILTRDVIAALVIGFTVGVVVELVARMSAQAMLGTASLNAALSDTFGWVPGLAPVLIAAVASARAAHRFGLRALPLVLGIVLAPHAYWTFRGEFGRLEALAAHKWTASALGPAFAWVLSVAFTLLATPLALFVCSRRFRRKRST